ncbi:ABZJ_00895 family protein [Dinoroseobacter sp. S375]|uniref:ABZJ_00895 family protein n=1 Tax=Dinoroseobacter sp. S375 TaxID=3415136 RepID=UPI003C7A7A18
MDPETKPHRAGNRVFMSISALLLRHALYTLICMVFVLVLSSGLLFFLDVDIGVGVSSVTHFVPAWYTGAIYTRRTKVAPSSGTMWKLSWIMSLINIVVGFLLVFAVALVFGIEDEMVSDLSFFGLGGGAIILGVVYLFGVVVARFSFGFGVKAEQRRQEELAAKDAM